MCQIERMLDAAEMEDLEELHSVIKPSGRARRGDIVIEIYSLPRVTALA